LIDFKQSSVYRIPRESVEWEPFAACRHGSANGCFSQLCQSKSQGQGYLLHHVRWMLSTYCCQHTSLWRLFNFLEQI